MRGLLQKDLYVMLGQGRTYLVLVAFYLVLTLVGAFDASFFSGFIVLVMTMLPMSTFTYDDLARWPKFAAATPAGRRGVVQGKYLFALCTLAASVVALLVMDLVYCAVRGGFSQLPDILVAGAACAVVGLFMDLILIPILFKFGSEKGRFVMMAVWVVIFLLFFGALNLLAERPGGLSSLPVPRWLLASAPVIALGVLAVAAVLSYSASLRIFSKKEL